ncbi:MAG: N-acetylglucosamine-6-phosphate deacetylase [Erysipelotrichaceae bacterium]|nr:N-acetylglucosamine-6-phosphate deacetylase [Erysipelotrichaceae bacterium]
MILYSKHIYLADQEIEGYLTLEGGKITSISSACDKEFVDCGDDLILPGFIDLHIHGWGTGSFWMEKSASSLYEMKKHLPQQGVTSFLATTAADPIEDILHSIHEAEKVMDHQSGDTECLGIHLEGPFINKEFKGMQDEDNCIDPSLILMKSFYETQKHKSSIKLMTIAPELPHAAEVIAYCHERGIQCSIGHSAATFETIKSMKGLGLGGVTHMFSGMKGLHHRELGVVGSALYFEDLMCEFAKQTGQTVAHEAFELVYRAKGSKGIMLCTDCAGLAKTNKAHYHYIRKQTFSPLDGKLLVTNDDGHTEIIDPLDYEAVKNLEMGYLESVINMKEHTKMSIHDIIRMTSMNPAKYIGVDDRKGSIEIGKDADLLVMSPQFELKMVLCKGENAYGSIR